VQAFQRLHRGYLIRQFYCFRSSPRGLVGVMALGASIPYRVADLWQTPTRNRNSAPSNRTEPISAESVTARSWLTALPSRIDADERACATANGPTLVLPLPADAGLNQVVETTATPSSARETFIGRGKPDQVNVEENLNFSLESLDLFAL
jgi:hypothetical protein